MKKLVAFFGLSLVSSAAFADKACWDGTFGYNYARVVETAQGLELSITGNNLSLPTLYAGSGQGFSVGNFSASNKQLHIVFPKSAVKTVKGTTVAELKGTIANSLDDKAFSIYLEHSVPDLGTYKQIVTPIPFLNAKAEIAEDAVTLDVTQLWGYTEEGDHLASTIQVGCNYDNAPESLKVPAKVKAYLKK